MAKRATDTLACHRIREQTGLEVGEPVAAILTCPECGDLLCRSSNFWSCPRLHGRLIPPADLVQRLLRVAFGSEPDAKDFLDQFKRCQERAWLAGKEDHPQGA